jgi:glycine hydroxymethyltransferase
LRGPRGGLILARANDALTKKFNSLVFPGTQGGPLMHVIAAKAIAFKEALKPEFKSYQEKVCLNAKMMASVLIERGYPIISGGTDNHLMLVSLIEKGITGKAADEALGRAFITVNKNSVPNDPQSPFITSGLRLGTPAITTRGFGEDETRGITHWIADILDDLNNDETIELVRKNVLDLCSKFPVYK